MRCRSSLVGVLVPLIGGHLPLVHHRRLAVRSNRPDNEVGRHLERDALIGRRIVHPVLQFLTRHFALPNLVPANVQCFAVTGPGRPFRWIEPSATSFPSSPIRSRIFRAVPSCGDQAVPPGWATRRLGTFPPASSNATLVPSGDSWALRSRRQSELFGIRSEDAIRCHRVSRAAASSSTQIQDHALPAPQLSAAGRAVAYWKGGGPRRVARFLLGRGAHAAQNKSAASDARPSEVSVGLVTSFGSLLLASSDTCSETVEETGGAAVTGQSPKIAIRTGAGVAPQPEPEPGRPIADGQRPSGFSTCPPRCPAAALAVAAAKARRVRTARPPPLTCPAAGRPLRRARGPDTGRSVPRRRARPGPGRPNGRIRAGRAFRSWLVPGGPCEGPPRGATRRRPPGGGPRSACERGRGTPPGTRPRRAGGGRPFGGTRPTPSGRTAAPSRRAPPLIVTQHVLTEQDPHRTATVKPERRERA